MDNSKFRGILYPENITYNADTARAKKAEIDREDAKYQVKLNRSCRRRTFLMWALGVFIVGFVVFCFVTRSGKVEVFDSTLLAIGIIGIVSLVLANFAAVALAPDYRELRYPASIKFYTIVDGQKIEPSEYALLGTGEYETRCEAIINLVVVNDKDEIGTGYVKCPVKLKKGISVPTLDMTSDDGVLYLPYVPLDNKSRIKEVV